MKSTDVYGIRELQRHLSRALKSVRQGRRIVVTDDGTPVAVILPSSDAVSRSDPEERKLARLLDSGKVSQLGRSGPRRKPRAWKLGAGWTRDFLDARR
jgi:prevent-host-death family protein